MFCVKHLHLYKSSGPYTLICVYTIYTHDNEIVSSLPSFDLELKRLDFAYYFLQPMEVTLWSFPIPHTL